MSDAVRWYTANAEKVFPRYESVAAEDVHSWLNGMLPKAPALILDVGAGSGRDAAWLARKGHEIVAVEPSDIMREMAQRHHPSPSIQWLSDHLPSLDNVFRLGLAFDLILLSAVWMHIPPGDRARAFRKLITLLKPGGSIAITLRRGPAEAERGMFEVSLAEIELFCRANGAFVQKADQAADKLKRADVTWTQVIVQLPDDGTGALPLLRQIVLNDDKSSTYKLALLRVLCRIADSASGYARDRDGNDVSVPLGLVGLYWLRMFKPLLAAGIPQNPRNVGDQGLGFVKSGFRAMTGISHLDLRVGARFNGPNSQALHSALRDACKTIVEMPAHHITYGDGKQVFPTLRSGRFPIPSDIHLNETYLSSFGEFQIPLHLWRALQRMNAWVEPALCIEWIRLTKSYAQSQKRSLSDGVISNAMAWSEPSRDVSLARTQALRLMETSKLHCVWSGKLLSPKTLDIDHCFPWATWPCDDLWNLLPADMTINRNRKREKLPGAALLNSAQSRIIEWWGDGYLKANDELLPERFSTEAKSSLPVLREMSASAEDVFSALAIQRMRLQFDQQIPIWDPTF